MRSSVSTLSRALTLVVLCACAALVAAAPALAEDITPPVVTAFSVTPHHVDTSSSTQTLTASVAIQDLQSGVGSVEVHAISALSPQWILFQVERVSGDASDGVYAATGVLPAGSTSGTWYMWVTAFDTVGNLASAPWLQLDTEFGAGAGEVVNDATVSDSAAPQATQVSITPAHIDTSSAAQTVDVSVTVTDDLSGVNGVSGWLHSARSEQQQPVYLPLSSGDEMSGVYTGTATLPRLSASGEWTLFLSASDAVGNSLGSDLEGASAQTTNDAAVEDVTPPQLAELSVTPSVFDTESAAQDLSITARTTDDLAGVSYLLVRVRPLLSEQMRLVELDRVSGDGLDTVLSGTITLPCGAEVGPWRTDVELRDGVGNRATYGPDQLATLLPDATGITLVNTAAAQQVIVRKDWVLTGEQSSVTFPAGTVVTRCEGGAFAFYKMVAQQFDFTADLPTEDLQGDPVATLRFGIPGLDLSFSQPVMVRMRVGDQYNGYLVHIQSLTEGGEAWANETEAAVTGGWVQFTVAHATRFVAAPARARVSKATPRTCRRGARVTITGLGFGEARGRSVVLLSGRACRTYTRWTPRSVTFVVPRGAPQGRLRLSVRVLGATTPAGRLTVRR